MNGVIIVAGGKGLRMGGDVPKQFLVTDGKPILMHTIERFHEWDASMEIVVVLPHDQQQYWRTLCHDYGFGISHTVVCGGAERFHSVQHGLAAISPACRLVAVHDGVRPYVGTETISRCFAAAERYGAAVPVTPVVETLRHIEADGSSTTVPRADYRLVQTPQVFAADLLRRAYEQTYRQDFTDDASVVEAMGVEVTLVEGNRENIKITTPADLR